jgi:cation transport ATPase
VIRRGDIVRLRAGHFVPADAQIIDGELQIDQSIACWEPTIV